MFSRFLIAGSIPLFISCILQSWFKVYGVETLNGLIIWFQKPVEENHFGVTGLLVTRIILDYGLLPSSHF